MSKREKIVAAIGASILGLGLGVAAWLLLLFASWYVGKIPEKRLPFAAFLWSGQKKLFKWLSRFFLIWFLLTLAIASPLALSGAALALVAPPSILLVQVAAYLSLAVGFFFTKWFLWNDLFRQAEAGARLLVGDNAYDTLTPAEKEQVKRHAVDCQVGLNKGTWVVSGGKTLLITPPAGTFAKFGGRGILVIQLGHAVFLEQKGRISRIVGVGVHFLEPFERPGMVVFLQTRTTKVKIDNLITKDGGIIQGFQGYLFSKANPGKKTRDVDTKYPFDPDELMKAWDPRGDDPGESVSAIAGTAIRTVLSNLTLEQVFQDYFTSCQTLRDAWIKEANAILDPYVGFIVIAAAIDKVDVSTEIESKLREKWAVMQDKVVQDTRNEIMRRRSETEKIMIGALEEAKRKARTDLLKEITDVIYDDGVIPQNMVPRFLDMIERLVREPVAEDITAKRQIEAVERVVDSKGEKHIYVSTPPMITPTD